MRQPTKQELQDLRLDAMLRSLRDEDPIEPSAEVRENLCRMTTMMNHPTTPGIQLPARRWLRLALLPASCAVVLVVIGLHYIPLLKRTPAIHPQAPMAFAHAAPTLAFVRALPVHVASPRRVRLVHRKSATPPLMQTNANENAGINLELPYSNPDIANGTGTTIQIALSKEQLMALGVSLGEASADGRYLAELALGDDGFPRAIHIHVPLRTIQVRSR